jgi:hypothetical protein
MAERLAHSIDAYRLRLLTPLGTLRFMKYLLLIFVAGCHGSSNSAPKVPLPPGCDAMLSQCLAIQQICAAGPTCAACPDGQYASSDGLCKPLGGMLIDHDFPVHSTTAGQEELGYCRSWTLNNATELWVNAVELDQDESSHHSNWLFVPDDKFAGPDGDWPCSSRSYDQLTAALEGGVLYAQSTQATHEVQKFPNAAAVRIPPYSRIISDIHILNATQQTVTGHARLSLYVLSPSELKTKLAPFHLGFTTLDIPPLGSSRNTASCDIYSAFENAFGHAPDGKLYYILPHYHALGYHFFVKHVAGPRDGQTFFDSMGAVGEARGRAFDPPLDLTGDEGLAFGCDFDNPTPDTVNWGFGNQEMCELLGFTDSPLVWDGSVGMVAQTDSQDSLPTFGGPCGVVAFQYDFNRPGGPPR